MTSSEEQKSKYSTEASNSNPNQPTKWNDKDVNRYIIVIVIINIENDLVNANSILFVHVQNIGCFPF